MYNENKILAIIPARGGSKGIKGKNIIDVNGKPLIYYTIYEASKSKYIDKIIVSTDSEEIANISKRYNAEVPFLRPKELAQDESKTIESLVYTIEMLKNNGEEYSYVILLQPTQPLRKTKHIDEAIEKIIESKKESLVSVSEVREHPSLMKTIDGAGVLRNIFGHTSDIRRQDFEKIYKVNGAIYINKINGNFNNKTSLNDNQVAYVMEQKYDLDIDDFDDLNMFKYKINFEKLD